MSRIMMRSAPAVAYTPINTIVHDGYNRLNKGNFLPPRPTNVIPVPVFNKMTALGSTKDTIKKQFTGG